MKKVLLTLVTAMLAIAFAGAVFAAEPVKMEVTTSTTSPAPEVKKEEKAPAKKKVAKKKKKTVKKATHKELNTPSATSTETTTPVIPAEK